MSRWKEKIIKILGGYTEPPMSEPALFVVHKEKKTVKLYAETRVPCQWEMGVEIKRELASLLAKEIEKHMYIESAEAIPYILYRGIIEVVVKEGAE